MTDFNTSQTIAGTLTDSVYDEDRGILYITTSEGLLLRWDVVNKVFKSPLNLGGHLTSVAISPDNGFLLVGRSDMFNESGDQWDYVGHTQIDRVALNTLAVTPLDMGVTGVIRGVHDIAITADGMALVTNLDNGGSSTQLFRTFNAAGASVGTAVVHPGGAMFNIGFFTPSWLVTSSDERYVLVLEGNNSGGDFAIYDSQTGTTTSGNLLTFNNSGFGFNQGVGDISSDAGLFAFAASSGEFYVSDLSLHLVRNMTGVVGGPIEGLQFLAGGHQLLVWTTASGGGHEIQVYDTATWAEVGTVANAPAPLLNGDAMQITDGGELLFLNTHDGSDGFAVIDLRDHLSIVNTGDSGNNTLVGYLGDDTLSGGDGDDLLIAGPGDDTLDGGAGNDTVSFRSAQFAVTASLAAGSAHGVDVNATLASIENILGSENFDTLTGDAGANRIEGGGGYDTLTGGGGADTFVYNPGFYGDVITDLGADDVIDLSGMHIPDFATLQLFMSQDGADAVIQFGDYSIRLSNKTLADLTAANFAFYTSNTPLNVVGTAGVDVLFGAGGDDMLSGGLQNDKLLGGGGSDTADYSSSAGGVAADLAISGPQNTGAAGVDTLISIENLNGSGFDDTLRGDGGANTLHGGAGDDILEGRAGNNLLFGEAGFDFAAYDHATAGVTVSLAIASAQNTLGAGTDTLSSIEGLKGSAFNDVLTGDAGANQLEGGAGDDVLVGGAGNDVLNGGAGIDFASYANAPDRVTVNLGITQAQDTTSAGLDRFVGIEGIIGSAFNDNLQGDSSDNVINGGAGEDVIAATLGNDIVDGGAGNADTITYGGLSLSSGVTINLGLTSAQSNAGVGSITLTNVEQLIGSNQNDILTGSAGANYILGGPGDDVIDGGAGADNLDGAFGIDTVSYGSATAGVQVSLAGGLGVAGSFDNLMGFENVSGSAFDDTLSGDSGANVLSGLAGNDTLRGFGGADTLDGGGGVDTASYDWATSAVTVSLANAGLQNTIGAGLNTLISIENVTGSNFNDVIEGDAGDNVLNGGAGLDTVSYASARVGVRVDLWDIHEQATGAGLDTLVSIENVTGSAFNDLLFANVGNNVINGGAGRDTVSYAHNSGAVNVSLAINGSQNTAGSGTDTLISIENLTGSNQEDTLEGDAGDNVIDGGDDFDIVSYVHAGGAVTIDLSLTTQNTGGAGVDTLLNIEGVIGSNFGDLLVRRGTGIGRDLDGGGGVDTVSYANYGSGIVADLSGAPVISTTDHVHNIENVIGSGFNDVFFGASGANVFDGGDGVDIVNYVTAAAGVTVSLGLTGPQNTGGAGIDTLIGIEALQGSNFADILSGGAGSDFLDGGSGLDTVSYAAATAGVTVNLSLFGQQNTGGAGSDTLLHFENVTGSAFSDTLTGDAGDNVLTGGLGDDILDGAAGLDTASYVGAAGAVTVSLAVSGAQNTGGAGTDTLVNIENLTGSLFNDTLVGTAGANVIDGGAGYDTVSYAGAAAGVTIDLSRSNQPQDTGGGGVDTLIGIENVIGSAFNDTIMGDGGNNVLNGGGGVDTLSYQFATAGVWATLGSIDARQTVGAGVDTVWGFTNLRGSSFGDFLFGDGGANVIEAGDGNDMLFSGGGADTLSGGAGDDIFAGKVAELSGSTITDFQVGDLIRIDDAAVSTINLSMSGATLSFTGNALNNRGALTLANLPSGYHLEVIEAGFQGIGNVILGLVKDAPRVLDNGLSGDFNGDGKDDLLWRSDAGQLSNWLGKANGGFLGNDANAFVNVPTNWHVVAAGDFNGDGRDDIVWRSDSGQMSDWLGTASGGWEGNDANALAVVDPSWKIIGAGDFNGDGRDDLLWRSDAGQLSNWLGQANGGFVGNDANAFASVPNSWRIVGVGDFNGDGRDDILWRAEAGQLSNWLGTTSGGWSGNDANAFVNVPTDWHVVGVGDFNGDGRSDILWRSDAGLMSNWLGTASGGWQANDANAFASVPTDWVIAAVGDYNGDGRDDIMWRHTSGAMSNWLGTASGGWAGNDANAYAVVDPSWRIQADGMFGV